jgi:eukaryotic-like serine/threonine-protein kinase
MPTDRWHRLEQLFTEAAAQPPSIRGDFLARRCGVDVDLRDEVGSLLSALDDSAGFLSTPALDVFARQIVREGWSVQPGDRIGSYTVERRLGAGGMGEVWRARDERLARDVAIKLLLPHPSNVERGGAFQQEARAAGSLNHTNVLTVYDVGEYGGAPYLVTECLEGESLRARLASGALPVDAALDIALQVSRGLGAAHDRGIVHRDLKPENIFLARDGRVKILDFGLATLLDAAPQSPAAGTAGYMAPEQVKGESGDRRTDIFAIGAVLYEMLSGRQAFKGDTVRGTLDASLTVQPRALSDVIPDLPPALGQIVHRCLAKSPAERFATAADLETALASVIRARNAAPAPALLTLLRRPAVIGVVLTVILALTVAGWRWRAAATRVHWARTVAAAEVQRLSGHGDYAEAFILVRQALAIAPDDSQLRQLWLDVSVPAAVRSDPPGADVVLASYRTPATWVALGRTPLEGVRIPRTLVRIRISKPGFQSIDGGLSPPGLRYRLDPVDQVPAGMVRVVGSRAPVRPGLVGEVDDYWIDRFEVTNVQFKAFVDRGGYQRREYWREPLIDAGRTVPWEDAIARFRDGTGRPGPATWQSGTYPAGQSDFPVGGVSWYEAAAYAAFAGKSLPTIYHWYRAANLGRFANILTVSNFTGTGPAAVGHYAGLGPFGTFDMAGNVKEWCANETDSGRFLLGGAWNEPSYMFADYDARGPFERAPGYGFRLAKYLEPQPAALTGVVRMEALGLRARPRQPVGDEIFAVYRRQHAYDRIPLNALVEATDETDLWVKQTIAFDAGYGAERMRAYLFLPKSARPPYQTVIFFPAGDAFVLRSSRDMMLAATGFIVGSGRAFLYPVYKGTYERAGHDEMGPNAARELRIAWSRDFGRAIDYLETRSDIDRDRLAFYGVSAGADAGVILTALEDRLKTAVLLGTGLVDGIPAEIDVANFAPRVRIPTLMVNGRYDFELPFEISQLPLFALLGSAPGHKRHAVLEKGHALSNEAAAAEILPWLDRYLGPVARSSPLGRTEAATSRR